MQPSLSKKARFDPALKALQILIFIISLLSSLVNSSSPSLKASFFPSSTFITQPINNLWFFLSRLPLRDVLMIQQSQLTVQTVKQNSPIWSEGPLNLLLVAYQRAKKEAEAEKRDNILFQESFDIEDDYTLLPYAIFANENLSETDSLSSEEENDWKNDDESRKESRLFAWMDSGNTSYAKEKLIRILAKEVLIPK